MRTNAPPSTASSPVGSWRSGPALAPTSPSSHRAARSSRSSPTLRCIKRSSGAPSNTACTSSFSPTQPSALPLEDNSVDTVISTLVLCTVDDPTPSSKRSNACLRPGGTFRFVEHVAAHPASPRRWLQRALVRPWAWLFEGCRLDRHTADAIDAAGFADVKLHRGRFRHSVFVPVNRAISGVATKSAARIQRPSSRPSST